MTSDQAFGSSLLKQYGQNEESPRPGGTCMLWKTRNGRRRSSVVSALLLRNTQGPPCTQQRGSVHAIRGPGAL